MNYSKLSNKSKKTGLTLRDMAVAAQYGALPTNRRIQVKMPNQVVEQLDALFPNIDRSRLLTQLALKALIQHERFQDNPDLSLLASEEQHDLDKMWRYLEERDAE